MQTSGSKKRTKNESRTKITAYVDREFYQKLQADHPSLTVSEWLNVALHRWFQEDEQGRVDDLVKYLEYQHKTKRPAK